MSLGFTYQVGRTTTPTVESGTLLTRVAGSFTSPLTAAPVRSASSDRLQLPVTTTAMTPQTFAAIIYATADLAYNDAAQPADGYVLEWYLDANNYVTAYFDKAAHTWRIDRVAAGVGSAEPTVSTTHAAGEAIAIYVAGDGTNVYLAAASVTNGVSAIASQANAKNPAIVATTYDVGRAPGLGLSYFGGRYDCVVLFNRILTLAEWQSFAALLGSRPPLMGEFVGSAMTSLWYGPNPFAWMMPTGSHTFDLFNTSGVVLERVLGAGVGPVDHRYVETPLRDGAIYITSRMKPRQLVAKLLLQGASMAGWYTLRRQLMAALNPRLGNGSVMFAPSTAVYDVDAMLLSGLGIDAGDWALGERPSLAFLCLDPTWRNAAYGASLLTVPAAGWSLPWSLPWSLAPSAITGTITNSGDIDTYPTFVFTAGAAGATGVTFTNNTTGKLYKATGPTGVNLAAGEVLTVDMNARTATKQDGSNQISQRSTASQMWPLVPGANSITVSVDTGAGIVEIANFNRYVGV